MKVTLIVLLVLSWSYMAYGLVAPALALRLAMAIAPIFGGTL